jgi:hypothetical protein
MDYTEAIVSDPTDSERDLSVNTETIEFEVEVEENNDDESLANVFEKPRTVSFSTNSESSDDDISSSRLYSSSPSILLSSGVTGADNKRPTLLSIRKKESDDHSTKSFDSKSSKRRSIACHRDAVGLRHGLYSNVGMPASSKVLDISWRPGSDSCNDLGDKTKIRSVEDQERYARNNAEQRTWVLSFYEIYSSFKVFALYLITFESLFTCALCVGLTKYWYDELLSDGGQRDGTLDRILLTFAIITPISVSIRMAFDRRERALIELAKFRSFACTLRLVTCCGLP